MHPTEAYESLLQHAAAQISRPECGFFEPDSLVWQVNRQRVLYLGGLRAILTQMAHPLVAQGVAEHSDFMHDPIRS